MEWYFKKTHTERALPRMNWVGKELKQMSIMDKMMEAMMRHMSEEDKENMMDKMMGSFFADMTSDDKAKMMAEMMPKMMEGVNMMEMMPKMMMGMMGGGEGKGGMPPMMSKMMGGGEDGQAPMMPEMMMHMMPHCLEFMLPKLEKEKRADFVLRLVQVGAKQGCAEMSEEEKADFEARIIEMLKG